MEIIVKRNQQNEVCTLGWMFIDDVFECYTLEDVGRKIKIWGKTRIPAGTYKIKLRKTGRFHNKYMSRFSSFHKGMLHVQKVLNFKYILIHVGNTAEDTAGCLLVGERIRENMILDSTSAYTKMYKKVIYAMQLDEEVTITYIDEV